MTEKGENAMPDASDPAIDAMTDVVKLLVDLMKLGTWPAVDFADERVILQDGGLAAFGTGEASGPDRAKRAADLALGNLASQINPRSGG